MHLPYLNDNPPGSASQLPPSTRAPGSQQIALLSLQRMLKYRPYRAGGARVLQQAIVLFVVIRWPDTWQ